MIITLQRQIATSKSTIGSLIVGSKEVNTLEDAIRDHKVYGETCIPPGQYKVTLRTDGGKNEHYAKRFPEMHKGMLWIRDIPDFEYVYIHVGNFPKDTLGCVLVGMGVQRDMITESVRAYKYIYPDIAKAIEDGEDVLIDVRNPS